MKIKTVEELHEEIHNPILDTPKTTRANVSDMSLLKPAIDKFFIQSIIDRILKYGEDYVNSIKELNDNDKFKL